MIDWALPLEAVGQGRIIQVAIDREYARTASTTPVKIPRNMWADTIGGGTWHFNNDGLAIGGISQDGYNGRYVLRNAPGRGGSNL
jgi:hypothetical protein